MYLPACSDKKNSKVGTPSLSLGLLPHQLASGSKVTPREESTESTNLQVQLGSYHSRVTNDSL